MISNNDKNDDNISLGVNNNSNEVKMIVQHHDKIGLPKIPCIS